MSFWGNFLDYFGNLLVDLFGIWQYRTFALLLCLMGTYLLIKCIHYMVDMWL